MIAAPMPRRFHDTLTEFIPTSRAQWRRWLAKHHLASPGVWLVYHKKASGNPTVSYADAVEEALCFGWIDSQLAPIDDHRYKQVFTPRKPGSVWSKLNKTRVDSLIAAGLMTDAGLARIHAAQADGSWATLDHVEALTTPPDLEKALAAEPKAAMNFAAFAPSCRKAYLYWINGAKRPETREKRIAETVQYAARNVKRRVP
jgi:uncharacterized protein YdeI (YjbR/CyaY-like superfamily)